MTITFVPGEVNRGVYSVSQATWRNHHIIAYGSGNNLIITTGTLVNMTAKVSEANISKHLQTVYLDADPEAVDINPSNGFIAITIKNRVILYKPVNEYMTKPQWTETLVFENEDGSYINCIRWAPLEDEIVIGTNESLSLYHIYDQYGELKYQKRWFSYQSNPVTSLKVSKNCNKIMTTSGPYDRRLKVFSRINYGDDNTIFELSYLQHPNDSYIVDFHKRIDNEKSSFDFKRTTTEGSLANIKNIRGYIDPGDDKSEVIYTVANDHKLYVWASYEYSGHSHISNWASLDLKTAFKGEEIAFTLIIENYLLQKSLIPPIKKFNIDVFKDKNLKDLDLLYVISKSGKVAPFAVWNITACPPNNIRFERLNPETTYEFDPHTFPLGSFGYEPPGQPQELTKEYIQSDEFTIPNLKPVLITSLRYLSHESDFSPLCLLLHDRIKNTLRFDLLHFRSLLQPTKETIQPLRTILLNKFQGHTKSIRRLIKSNSSFSDDNILLSISNFPEHNYIWEPFLLNEVNTKKISITKRFQLDVSSSEDKDSPQGIWNAAILNDIEPPKEDGKRRHLVVSIDKLGYLGLWDCNGSVNDDQPADLLERLSIVDAVSGDRITREPSAFILTECPNNTESLRQYCVIAFFEKGLVHAWRISIAYISATSRIKDIGIESIHVDKLPHEEKIFQMVTIDRFVSQVQKSVVAVISEEGLVRSFAMEFEQDGSIKWRQTHSIHTNVKRASKLHGATVISKMAVVDEGGLNLSVWDIKTGVLEYEEKYPEKYGRVRDLDWTYINSSEKQSTSNAILSVGFQKFVLLYTQLRYDYTNNIPTFAVLKRIDISDFTSHDIGDSIWLNDGYLVIGSGNQFFIDDKWIKLGSSNIDSTIRQLMVGYTTTGVQDDSSIYDGAGYQRIDKSTDELIYDISHLVRVLNGPLPVYHPQFLIQAMFMNQNKLVQDILVKLFQDIRRGDPIAWDLNLDIYKEIMTSEMSGSTKKSGQNTPQIDYTRFDRRSSFNNLEVFKKFDMALADLLINKLMKISLPLLTRHQQSTLISIISIVKDLTKYVVSLDENGIRFLIGFKLFQLSTKQSKLSIRDINWALHSDNKEMLLTIIEEHYKNRMKWEHIKQTGLVYWTKTPRFIKIMEAAARNEFSEKRDPSGRISLFYLALRKKQILVGLWRTVTHPEQQKMLKFLNNDFTDSRWKSAALKNAFVLLGKHRYIDASYFFLLGGAIKDCCSTLAGKVGDVQLAIAISKIYEGSESVPQENQSLIPLIESYVLPDSVSNGDRWTTSWIFWQLDMKELSIQALINSPIEMVLAHKDKFSETCNNSYIKTISTTTRGQSFLKDDPVLIILFNDLRQKRINYLKGSLDISPKVEFRFIIKVCMIYTRMGCDYLAVLLLRNYNFLHSDSFKKAEANGKADVSDPFKRKASVAAFNGNGTSEQVPDILASFNENVFSEKKSLANKAPPPESVFQEPDMSSFSFGF
ncbi:regulator of V-ATPase [Scheffersomyces xylosifermentans]|uniref:regulator of V-ATPase n=1 Tax=Scheffersomyces xylosifermentans TaxID=1304137 RepID=UPI00315D8E92